MFNHVQGGSQKIVDANKTVEIDASSVGGNTAWATLWKDSGYSAVSSMSPKNIPRSRSGQNRRHVNGCS